MTSPLLIFVGAARWHYASHKHIIRSRVLEVIHCWLTKCSFRKSVVYKMGHYNQKVMLSSLMLRFQPHKVTRLIDDTPMFFIVGMGRSGTVFLSNLLDGVESTAVFHEFSADRSELVRSYLTAERGDVYLRGARARVIASRIMHTKCRVYGEVNSYLRYHISGLQRLYQANVLHLVRDGRAVVRSIMNRKAYTASDQRHTGQIRPKPGDPYEVQWEHMERFERVCWYWARTNQDILSHDLPLIRLEDITQDYTAFQAQVLHPLGLAIDWADWKKVCDQPKNVSEAASFPEESQWTQKQIGQFDAICGPVMERLGY